MTKFDALFNWIAALRRGQSGAFMHTFYINFILILLSLLFILILTHVEVIYRII